jgi:hypothetical protein
VVLRRQFAGRRDGSGERGGRIVRAEDQFHVGIVAEDFEATLAEFSQTP